MTDSETSFPSSRESRMYFPIRQTVFSGGVPGSVRFLIVESCR